MLKRFLKNEKGLTLIELLAVIVILGIVAAIAIPAVGNIIHKSKVDAVKADAVQILSSAKTYVAANGVPSTGVITSAQLADFVSDNKWGDNYQVEVDAAGKTFKFDSGTNSSPFTQGAKSIDGISFNIKNATSTDISDDKTNSDTISIVK
ncbi:prepilin-type N-terminal cleavage/methylation domain-containing protein [Bacillus sp. RG28]|uniref:Prepilin-type N-terminal cleavage/methylation domain-containing protein n=1 Tax=Gottfriedia endophytica TaxID=2820819 RepID=A0A940SIW1_9BACI|nr:prepilin-type N-terminal cleavage/methylation domain-containing protein [Gottfriedia endophytica]MBP0725405.1 prepilin-type N-terminal cleavage/methylation domain-containing protein [Gottfriedia endophytica]